MLMLSAALRESMTALESSAERMRKRNIQLRLCHIKPRKIDKLRRYRINEQQSVLTFADNMQHAKQILIDKFALKPNLTPGK